MKSVKNNHRSRTRALESRVAELEGNLEEETERRTTLEKVGAMILTYNLFSWCSHVVKKVEIFLVNYSNSNHKHYRLFVTRNLVQALKRLERLLKELELQGMEDTQTIERQVEQIANVNNRNKQLKTQFADAVSDSSLLLFY